MELKGNPVVAIARAKYCCTLSGSISWLGRWASSRACRYLRVVG